MPKRISKTLLFTMIIAIVALFAHTEANAKVCIFHLGGTCIFWSGSVEGELTADDLGDIIAEPKFFELIIRPGQEGLLYCERPGSSNNRKQIPVTLTGSEIVTEIGSKKTILRGNLQNGKAYVRVKTKLNQGQLNVLDSNGLCGSPPWKAIDFVPKEFEALVNLKGKKSGSENVIDHKTYNCELPTYQTLGWEGNEPERRPYACKEK